MKLPRSTNEWKGELRSNAARLLSLPAGLPLTPESAEQVARDILILLGGLNQPERVVLLGYWMGYLHTNLAAAWSSLVELNRLPWTDLDPRKQIWKQFSGSSSLDGSPVQIPSRRNDAEIDKLMEELL
jgi:hypothetical protein